MKTNKIFAAIAALTLIIAFGLIITDNHAFAQPAPGGSTECTDPATGRVVPCPDDDSSDDDDSSADHSDNEPGLGGVTMYADLNLADPIRELGPELEFIAEALDRDDAIYFRCNIDFEVLMELVQQLEENGVENAFAVALNRLLQQCVIPQPIGPGVQLIDFIITSPGDDNPPSLLLIRANDDNDNERRVLFLVDPDNGADSSGTSYTYIKVDLQDLVISNNDSSTPGFDGLFFVGIDNGDDTDTRDVNCKEDPNNPGKEICTNTDGCNDVLSCLEVAIFCWVNEGDYDGDANTCTVDKN